MIPLPPVDRALPGMWVALDGDAMAEVLHRHFRERPVNGCEPHYVKYKPDKYCRVQYALALGSESRPAHVLVVPAKRAARLRARLGPSPAGGAFIGELNAIAQLYPLDLGLPGLSEAASPDRMLGRLATLLAGLRHCEVEAVRYKAAKRAVLKYRLGGAPVRAVYGKLRKDGGGAMPWLVRSFRRAGIATPALLAHFSDLGLAVQAEAAGIRLRDLRNTPDYERWMEPVADTLAHLHGSTIERLPAHDPAQEERELGDAAGAVGRLLPHLVTEAADLASRLLQELRGLGGERTAIHGSFHDDQVLVGDHGVSIVDLDRAALGNPQTDLGHFLSYLSAEDADAVGERFLTAYASIRPKATRDHRIFEAAALLRWATLPFRELRPDWPEAVEARVRLAGARLDAHERHVQLRR